jgi:hypothetical protein
MSTIRTVKELKELIEYMGDDQLILTSVYDMRQGTTTYMAVEIEEESISLDNENQPIECQEGDGGNNMALILV